MKGDCVAALDFGSSKVALAVGRRAGAGIRIVGYYDAPSAGIECGEIDNDFKVAETVRQLVEQAEQELGEKIAEVAVGLSGRVLHRREQSCTMKRRNAASSIQESEVRQLIRSQYGTSVGKDEAVFEAVPQRFNTEDRIGIVKDELIGMVGSEVEAEFVLFSGRKAILDRRLKVLEQCGLRLHKAILAPIASARAVLTSREMENGVALVDIGKGTTEVAIVKDYIVRHVAVIPFAGEAVTCDIKTDTGITRQWAENIKVLQGRSCEEYAIENRKLVLRDENDNVDFEVDLMLLTRIIEARLSEIFDAVAYVIEQSGYAGRIPSGVVITGGTAHLDNILQLAGSLLGRMVRLAAPQGSILDDSAEFAFDVYASTAVGLVLESLDPKLSNALAYDQELPVQPIGQPAGPEPAPEPQPQPVKRGGFFGGRRGGGSKGGDEGPGLFDGIERMFRIEPNDNA